MKLEEILPLTINESKIKPIITNTSTNFVKIDKYKSQKCNCYSFHRPISKVKIF